MAEDRWDRRLANWALYKAGVDSVSRAVEERYRRVRQGDWRIDTSEPPKKPQPLVGEALDTDRLVRQLIPEHHKAVEVVFLWTYPETLEARCAELNPPIHRNTLTNRLNAAKQHLEELDGTGRRMSRQRLILVTAC